MVFFAQAQEKARELRVKAYSLGEEIANAVIHGIGAGLSIAALVILVVFAAELGDPWRVASFAVYGATLIVLYLSSTLYHGLRHAGAKRWFKRLDHAAIFLLIAGTYTPLMLVKLRTGIGWTMFGVVWGLAVAGATLKLAAIERLRRMSLLLYLGMGWMSLLVVGDLAARLSPGGLMWLLLGGAAYTFGVLFYVCERPYAHAIWHGFVLAGSTCHFFAMLFYVLPAGTA